MLHATFAAACGASILAEVLTWLVLRRLCPPSCHKEIDGSPWLDWAVGLCHQAAVFPPITILALWPVLVGQQTLHAWLCMPWADDSGGCAAFHIALIAYWAKDCLVCKMKPLFWAHHSICLFATFCSRAGWLETLYGAPLLPIPPPALGSTAEPLRRARCVTPRTGCHAACGCGVRRRCINGGG